MRLLTTEEGVQIDMVERANNALAANRLMEIEQVWAMVLFLLDRVGGRVAGEISDDGVSILEMVGKGNYAPKDPAEQSDLLCLAEHALPRTVYGWRWLEAIVRLRLTKRHWHIAQPGALGHANSSRALS